MDNQLIIYPEFDERIERDYLYHVSVTQGTRTETLPVYNHTEDSRVNRNPLDGRRADEFRRFSTFAFAGEGVRVDIRVGRDFHDYAVMPARKRFRHSFKDGVISVYLDRPDYFVIRLDGGDHTNLAVFADAPETELPRADEKTIVVDRWQEVEGGVLTLTEPHTTVYIPAGAVLNARIQVLADDCRIIGRGAIVDPVGDIYRYSAAALDTGGAVLIKSVNRTLVDGIHFLDAKAFNLEVIGTWEEVWATDNLVRNVKILSTQMSSDGITFCYYAKNSRAEHCFVYCGDNALVYEEYAHYRDITIGTTCNALYPQTDVVDSSAEDIYVFRADEGLINITMGGENGITRSQDHVIRNFSAVDITFTPYFLFVELPKSNPAVTIGEGLTVENVWLRKLSDTLTCDFYRNIAAGDYKVTLKNCSVDGILLRDITPETVGGAVVPAGHSFRYLTEGDFDPCIPSARETADYRNALNVYVGHWQIFFPEPIRFEGGEILLPAETLWRELRAACMAETVLRDGIAYVRVSDLTGSGMAKSVERAENRLILTPKIAQTVWFYDSLGKIDFETTVDWQERHEMLKAAFPVDVQTDKATFEIQFGNIERPTHFNTTWEQAKFETCAQKYADLSDGGYGVSILNDCKYGHDIHDGVIQLSLLRAPTYPDPEADHGIHMFTYSLCPHVGTLRESDTVKMAYYLNQPMTAIPATGEKTVIPKEYAAVECDCPNIVCETVKAAEDGSGTVMRFYECANKRTRAKITVGLPATKAILCDLMENQVKEIPLVDGSFRYSFGNFEIVTVRVL